MRFVLLRMASGGYALEDLRKQARHLENEIDLKLVSFSKLGTGLGSRDVKSDRFVGFTVFTLAV